MERLSLKNNADLARATTLLRMGCVLPIYFNGGFALVGDAGQAISADNIFEVKQRPRHKTLALVCPPEALAPFVDQTQLSWPLAGIVELQTGLHGLGAILPANLQTTPEHLLVQNTILNVWTEYEPLRHLHRLFVQDGGLALHGASANLSGQPTLITIDDVVATFDGLLPAVLADPHDAAPENRRRSTSIVDFTGPEAILRRRGNVSAAEIDVKLAELGFGRLIIPHNVRTV